MSQGTFGLVGIEEAIPWSLPRLVLLSLGVGRHTDHDHYELSSAAGSARPAERKKRTKSSILVKTNNCVSWCQYNVVKEMWLKAPARQIPLKSGFKSRSSKFFFVHPKFISSVSLVVYYMIFIEKNRIPLLPLPRLYRNLGVIPG